MLDNISEEKGEIQEKSREDDKKMKILWIFIAAFFICSTVALFYGMYRIFTLDNSSETANINPPKNEPIKENIIMTPRLIDGVLTEEGEMEVFPLAVVIDNHPDSQPPQGLSQANLVIEAEVEGGLTRYLAIFADNVDHEQIGPVRSARPYFIDWVREYSALYTHVGGSPEALVKMKKENIFHINEFYNEHKFWRDSSYPAPHNVFTSTKLLYDYIEENKKPNSPYFSWQYKDDLALETRPEQLDISIAYPIGNADWQYNRTNNDFVRLLSDELHQDANGEEIRAKNVIIQIIPAEEIDELLRLKMDVVGEGEAIVCLDGDCAEGKWKKKNASARTRYYTVNDDEVILNRGTTWVEVVRPEREVFY